MKRDKMKFTTTGFIVSFFLVICLIAMLSSCGKKRDTLPPLITLTSPQDSSAITIPDSARISGKFTDGGGLHEATILILNSSGDTIFKQYPYVHDLKLYSFAYNFFPSVADVYTLKFAAEDHDELSSEKAVNITVH